MTNLFAITAAALLSAAASPVIASETRAIVAPTAEAPQAAASTGTPRVANARTKYCVVEQVTGSRIPVKTCATRQEWLDRGFDPLAND